MTRRAIILEVPLRSGLSMVALAHVAGTVFPSATLVVPDAANPSAYLTFELQNVVISGYQTTRGEQPMESISFNYSKIRLTSAKSNKGKSAIQNMKADAQPADSG